MTSLWVSETSFSYFLIALLLLYSRSKAEARQTSLLSPLRHDLRHPSHIEFCCMYDLLQSPVNDSFVYNLQWIMSTVTMLLTARIFTNVLRGIAMLSRVSGYIRNPRTTLKLSEVKRSLCRKLGSCPFSGHVGSNWLAWKCIGIISVRDAWRCEHLHCEY